MFVFFPVVIELPGDYEPPSGPFHTQPGLQQNVEAFIGADESEKEKIVHIRIQTQMAACLLAVCPLSEILEHGMR